MSEDSSIKLLFDDPGFFDIFESVNPHRSEYTWNGKAVIAKKRDRMKTKTKFQKRLVGMSRLPMPSSLLPAIAHKIEKEASRYGVSRSFVIAVALAHTFNIKEQEEY